MRLFKLGIVVLAIAMAAGCQFPTSKGTDGEGEPPEALQVSPELRYSDIPVPRGFMYTPKESWAYEGKGSVRLADLRYRGKASLRETMEFFLEQMPISGWQKDMVVGMETRKRLRFSHKQKSDSCEILIEKRMGTTDIQIRIN